MLLAFRWGFMGFVGGRNAKFLHRKEFQSVSAALSTEGTKGRPSEGTAGGKADLPTGISFPTPMLNFMWGI